MIIYCSKCGINWARLWDDGEENSMEVCPECKTDQYLQPGNDIISYIKCPFTGRIVNIETGEPHPAEEITRPVTRPRPGQKKVYDETYQEYEQRVQQAEDAGIAAGSFAGVEMPKRKFHYEEIS